MRSACFCLGVAALAGLAMSSPSRAEEWQSGASSGQNDVNDVVASFKHTDGAALLVICDTVKKHLSIAFSEPRAKWSTGTGIDVMMLPDSGQQPSPSHGIIESPTQVILKHDVSFDVWTMEQAKGSFKMSVGDYARVFPAANFATAVQPVLKACGAP
jgi:hypothetical protein